MEITGLLLNRINAAAVLSARSLGAAAFCAAAAAGAQENAAEAEKPAAAGEKITAGTLRKRIGGDALSRAFGWSDMLIVPAKLSVRAGRTEVLYVQNRSNVARDFRIVLAPDKKENAGALPKVRYGPRQFSLLPEEVQTVRIVARTPEGEPARARLNIRLLPPVEPAPDDGEEEEEGVSISFAGIYEVSVPVDVFP